MNRIHGFARSALGAVCLTTVFAMAGALATPRPAQAQVVGEFPSAAYLATVAPIYYENHASYWWGDHWRWRDGGGWHTYGSEPGFLHDRRMSAPATRRSYSSHGGHSFRGGGRAHGGGHR
jgi:hypothetical protein